MPGLDPGIHREMQGRTTWLMAQRQPVMDCRVKPGNDDGEAGDKSYALSRQTKNRTLTPDNSITGRNHPWP
jgi:hypothetical protein